MNIIEVLEQEQLRSDIPDFRAGSGAGVREMFTVRRISYGVGVERTFPIHSPRLEKIEVSRRGIVRRAKLYYLRSLTGKAARIRERR